MRALILSLALIAPTVFGLPAFAQTETTEQPAPPSLPAITVSEVALQRLTDRVLASGLVGPVEQVAVQPLIEGQPIEKLLADVGDTVEAGQVLAVLSKTSLELQKSQFQASLASARATVAQGDAQLVNAQSSADEANRVATRSAALQQQGTVSQAALDQTQSAAISATSGVTVAVQSLEAARAQLSLAEAQLANIDLQLSRTQVVAPVSGEIVQRNAQIGSIASAAGQAMFTLVRDGELELLADIAEADLIRLAVGQTAKLRIAGSSTELTGSVRLVEPTIDSVTRLGRARILIDDETGVRSGMFVEAEVLVSEHESLAVPVTAVGAASKAPTVMKVVDGVVSQIDVAVGIRDAGWVEITSGLVAGDLVVTKAGAFVRNGDQINPIPASTN